MSDVSLIIKMVDEVVKPLISAQEALAGTQNDFRNNNQTLEALTYRLMALRDCFETESKNLCGQSGFLDELLQKFSRNFKALEKVSQELKVTIQSGIINASSDLKHSIETEVRAGLQSEMGTAVASLNHAIDNAKETLAEHQAITWMTHAKFISIALLTGLLVGAFTVWWGFRKLSYLPCQCQCVLRERQPEAANHAEKPAAEALRKDIEKPRVGHPKLRR